MAEPLFSVAGRVACVTGASSGLGRRAALVLARNGAKVVGVARRARGARDGRRSELSHSPAPERFCGRRARTAGFLPSKTRTASTSARLRQYKTSRPRSDRKELPGAISSGTCSAPSSMRSVTTGLVARSPCSSSITISRVLSPY
ncbi:MAG: SDR family NAD(P)-dependent oxidoreductase [Anaerolineales bacterium]|nr:SDR family NAD(P)-dependent oxidoreductase [Anaerolineales bacterium]